MMPSERALESDVRGTIPIPSCPNCHSKTGLSYENPGARLYVCRDCAYPWDSELRGTPPPRKAD
jgi:transposase-like protein